MGVGGAETVCFNKFPGGVHPTGVGPDLDNTLPKGL